jgi:hypothetical protein
MQFASGIQQTCYERILPWITEIFGGQAIVCDDLPMFILRRGSAVTMVEVLPWEEQEAIVRIWARVVSGCSLTPDLMRYLLTKNIELPFGAFGIDEDGDIRLEHNQLGSTCDKEEIEVAARAIIDVADRFDDEILRLGGGSRALDRMREQMGS